MGKEHVFTGGCLCGAFHTIAGFPVSSFRFTQGRPKIFDAPSGIKELGFCTDCGSPIWDRYFEPLSEEGIIGPNTVWIPIGTLDNPEAVNLEFHYCVESQLPWVKFDDDLPRIYSEEEKALQAALERAKTKET